MLAGRRCARCPTLHRRSPAAPVGVAAGPPPSAPTVARAPSLENTSQENERRSSRWLVLRRTQVRVGVFRSVVRRAVRAPHAARRAPRTRSGITRPSLDRRTVLRSPPPLRSSRASGSLRAKPLRSPARLRLAARGHGFAWPLAFTTKGGLGPRDVGFRAFTSSRRRGSRLIGRARRRCGRLRSRAREWSRARARSACDPESSMR